MCQNPSIELLQAKYNKLLEKVWRMRGIQQADRRYHGMIPSDDKARLRKLEKEVDGILMEEVKERKSQQQKLL